MFSYKNVDVLSVLNQKNTAVSGAWGGNIDLVAPTNRLWPIAEIPRNWPSEKTPHIHFVSYNVSASFNKIVFPSITPYSFLTQSVSSYVYYLDVYSSLKIPLETTGSEHINISYGIYADSPKLVFENSASEYGYSTLALIPDSRVFTLAWGSVSESIGMINTYATTASYVPNPTIYQQPNSVYNTYKTILHETGSTFLVGTGSYDNIYVIHLDKNILKNGIITGSVQLPFMKNAVVNNYSNASNIYTSSYITITDSKIEYEFDYQLGGYSLLVSGTVGNTIETDVYGKIYYDLGIFVLDANKLNQKLNLNMYTGSTEDLLYPPSATSMFEEGLNHYRLFKSLQACSYLNSNTSTDDLLITTASNYSPQYFKCKIHEDRVINPVFLVVKPNEFNYTNNPSWIKNELNEAGIIESSSLPKNCQSFINADEGCDKLNPLEQRYVYWYYPSKQSPTKIYAAYFYKYEKGDCECEYLGDFSAYKLKYQLPHTRFKKYLVKDEFKYNPITYITTIGLYDDMYRLLAVGKLSKPLKKDSVTTYMFKVNIKS